MNCLLDTHVFLWMLAKPESLSAKASEVIQNPNNTIFVSAITSVEIAIKSALGKLEAPTNLGDEIPLRGLTELPFRYAHGERMRELPPHHADPFDRMLIAQAMTEDLVLVTHDRKMEPYSLKILWT